MASLLQVEDDLPLPAKVLFAQRNMRLRLVKMFLQRGAIHTRR
jgi:hypothetical protein